MYNKPEITKAILIHVPQQHEMYYRPFEANLNGSIMTQMEHVTDQGRNLSSGSMAPVAGSILSPSTVPQEQLIMPGGMNNSRFAFFIECTAQTPHGTRRELITGFTDRSGVSASGAIDPNMVFHVNSITEIADTQTVGPTNQYRAAVLNTSQVLADRPVANTIFTMRPEDVVGVGQLSLAIGGGANVAVETRNRLLNVDAKLSSRDNAVPSTYLSKLTKGYLSSANAIGISSDFIDADEDLYADTMAKIRSENVTVGYFYSGLGVMNNESTHKFTFSQLNMAWPRSNDFWTKIMPRPGSTVTSPLENSEHWRGANISTNLAFSLTHVMPSLMARLLLLKVELSITNMTLTGQPQCTILDHTPMFDGCVTNSHLDHLVSQMELEVINGVLKNKVNIFNIHMKIDMLTTSTFNISINGEQAVPYTAPMFCDSYYSPVLGLDNNNLTAISNTVETMVDRLGTLINPDAGSFMDTSGGVVDMNHTPNYSAQGSPQINQQPVPPSAAGAGADYIKGILR